ncbi:hypothetical protein EST38_g1248 [Candolleomyces aberdarensis]|uniref:Uncharacterized protein n=1 Tax=Candolleomyces aberdarensis TaxID=2316362 RepID=A0A4Q2DZ28_9AGAR|nr:hypothetical protein EST38_g1248 [Candolleomyces aberdarensis]
MNPEVLSELEPWKKKRFRKQDLRLGDVADSVQGGQSSLVDPRPSRASPEQWCLYNKTTNNVAVITYACVYSWGSSTECGNFVPIDEVPPSELPSSRVQSVPSAFCELSFAFETGEDRSLYSHLETLETLIEQNTTFNKLNRPKRNWQSGDNPTSNRRYVATAKLFMRKTPFNLTATIPYKIHPWLQAVGDDPASRWMPNKDRPNLFHYRTDTSPRFLPIEYGKWGLQRGDIVWISFIVTFTMKTQTWSTSIVPLDIIRVGRLEALPSGKEAQAPAIIEQSDYRPPDEDFDDGEFDGSNEEGNIKRKRDDDEVSAAGSVRSSEGESDGPWVGVEKEVAMMEIDDAHGNSAEGEL